jgi:hypothetical protein
MPAGQAVRGQIPERVERAMNTRRLGGRHAPATFGEIIGYVNDPAAWLAWIVKYRAGAERDAALAILEHLLPEAA